MKLELKHLAAYLPYNLYFLMSDGKTRLPMSGLNRDVIFVFDGYSSSIHYKDSKPILRPMSEYYSITFSDDVEESLLGYFHGKIMNDTERLPYFVIQEFLKHHLDIYGLIDNGLAIDINTLK